MLLPTATPAPVPATVPSQARAAVPAPPVSAPAAAPDPLTRRLAMPVLAAGLVGCLALYGAIAFALLHVAIGLFA